MALTIFAVPDLINAAYRPILFFVSSNLGTIKGIRGDLYINGTYSSTIDGVQILGTTDSFTFDIRKMMQSQLVHELRTNITTFSVGISTISAAEIKIRFYEIYESGGVFTTTWAEDGAGTGYEESSDYHVANTATQHQENLTDYTVDDATKLLLTTSADNVRIPRGVPFQIGYLGGDVNYKAEAIERDINLNTLTTTTTIFASSPSYSKGYITIPTSLMSNTNTAYLDVKLTKSAVGDRSITYRYKVVDSCNSFVLFWQNHLGGFDHFDFGNKVTKQVNTKNQTMTQSLESGFSVEDAGIITLESNTSTKVKVQTGSLSQAELTMLGELMKNHTVVYKWDSAGVFLRYVVKSHSTKIEDNDGLINSLSLILQPSNEHIVQKGS